MEDTPRGHGQGRSSQSPQDQGVAIAELLKPPKEPPVYFNGNDHRAPRADLFDSEAQAVAKRLADLPASQLRRFYASVMSLRQQRELARDGLPVELLQSRMGLLKAQAAYTRKRDKDYPDELVSFFTRHAAGVKSWNDFLYGFQPHFEAVVAYHKVFEKKKRERT